MSNYKKEKKISIVEVKELLEALDGWGIVVEDDTLVDEKLKDMSFYFRWEKPVTHLMVELQSGGIQSVTADTEILYHIVDYDDLENGEGTEKACYFYEADKVCSLKELESDLISNLEEFVESGLSAEEENEVNLEDHQADEFLHLKNQYLEDTGDLQ